MYEELPYQPAQAPSHERAAMWTPKYLYRDTSNPAKVTISDDFYGTRRKLRIGVLGAGIAGMNFLHFLEEKFPAVNKNDSLEVVVYDQNEDVGGVWCSSRYPGCRTDSSSASYQFSWRPHVYSQFYPPAAEIQAYMKMVAEERDFYRYIKFRHQVVKASWDDTEAKWTLGVRDLEGETTFEDKVDLFVEFNGAFSHPKIDVEGIEDFKGTILHPGKWDPTIDLKDKRIALVGYGSTGTQIAPYLAKEASHFYHWHRQKTFIFPPPAQDFSAQDGYNFAFTPEQKSLLADPDIQLAYRKAIDSGFHMLYRSFINGGEVNLMFDKRVTAYMHDKLSHRPDILNSILPSQSHAACRRPIFNHGYISAITSPKSTFFLSPPQCFTSTGLISADGTHHSIDLIVAATGHEHSFFPRYPKFVNGIDLREKWKDLTYTPSYLGLGLDGLPNYFNPSLAYTPTAVSWFLVTEPMAKYIVQVIDKMQLEHIISLTPKSKAIKHFIAHADAFSERVVQGGPCSTYYKNSKTGKSMLWPGGRTHFLRVLERPRYEDYDIRYEDEDDMFAYLGNGYDLEIDGDPDGDQAWYLGQPKRKIEKEVIDKLRGKNVKPLTPWKDDEDVQEEDTTVGESAPDVIEASTTKTTSKAADRGLGDSTWKRISSLFAGRQ